MISLTELVKCLYFTKVKVFNKLHGGLDCVWLLLIIAPCEVLFIFYNYEHSCVQVYDNSICNFVNVIDSGYILLLFYLW